MLAPIYPPLRDLRLSGHVIHTGRSSMEVAVQLVALDSDGTEETLMLGKCVRDNRRHSLLRTRVQVDSVWFAGMLVEGRMRFLN